MKTTRQRQSESGVALMVVLLTLALIASVVSEFQYSSSVDAKLAYNARDELQAEYNALTALRLRALLLRESRSLERAMNEVLGALGNLGTGGDGGEGSDPATGGGAIPIGQILELIPVECGLLSGVIRESDPDLPELLDEDEDEGSSATVADSPDVFIGDCESTSTSEHSKISLNVLGNLSGGDVVFGLLTRLLSDPRFERHFVEDDRNGIHANSPSELVGAIADWVDRDRNQRLNEVSDEDSEYNLLRDAYKPKNAPFDSLAELQLVHGVDDELYDFLESNVTIYTGSQQIDLTTATEAQLLFGLLGSLRPEVTLEQANQGIIQLYYALAEARGATLGVGSINVQLLTALISAAGLEDVIDQELLASIFTDRPQTTWYTINATGRAGNVERQITAVFQAQEAKFYYYRVE